MSSQHHGQLSKLTFAGLLITLGIIYGDIGTSPLYVMKAIIGKDPIVADIALGGVSCIFWTLTLQTTIKYVYITLNADNNGEGGIFALYALVKRTKVKWLIVPAVIGGSALLADGIITPPISVSSAVEGLRSFYPEMNTVGIVIAILFVLFDVEIIFFYPYAVNFKGLGWSGFWAVLMFVGFFLCGFIYILKKGALDWED